MIRLVKWVFPNIENPSIKSKCLVIGNKIMLSIMYKGCWSWGVCGLGLTEAERYLLKCNRWEFRNPLNIYLGKLVVSYDKMGYIKAHRNVRIIEDKVLI